VEYKNENSDNRWNWWSRFRDCHTVCASWRRCYNRIENDGKAQKAVDKVKDLLDDVENLKAAENPDAAKEADVLVLTVLLASQRAILLSIKEGATGKILMDATGPLETAIGGSLTRCLYLPEGAASERAQKILPDTNVICAFNNISSGALMNYNEPIDCDCLISGDNQESKITVAKLIEKIPGVQVVDCGPLERAQIIEKITPLLIGLNIKKACKINWYRP